jgi:acetyl esterase/lipase
MAKSRHLVDPELVEYLDAMPPMKLSRKGLPQMRANMAQMLEQLSAIPRRADVLYGEETVPGPKGAPGVRVLIYSPKDGKTNRPAYYHVHGGGYVAGVPEMNGPRNALIAAELGVVVVSVDYRLAPETSFPGNVEDCYAGLKWLHANASSLGVDKNRIAIGGESAGGGLAAALALLARDRRKIKLIHQQLTYPMIDDRVPKKVHGYTGEFGWTRASNVFGWEALLGKKPGGPRTSPYAAAARATNLKGLPPAYLSTGALDLFLDENVDYAMRLTRAGIPVEVHIYPGAYHGFEFFGEGTRVAKQAARDHMEALRAAFARTAPK